MDKALRRNEFLLKDTYHKFDWRSQDLDEITYVREKWGRFEGKWWGEIRRALLQKPGSAQCHDGHDYEGGI
ncbi:hypothetical protein Tco_0714272 [Tanacetum coccineum]